MLLDFELAIPLQFKCYQLFFGGAYGVMVIIVGNGHGDTSSNPGPG